MQWKEDYFLRYIVSDGVGVIRKFRKQISKKEDALKFQQLIENSRNKFKKLIVIIQDDLKVDEFNNDSKSFQRLLVELAVVITKLIIFF